MTNPAQDYMRMKVHSASSVGLVVLLYDIGIEALHNALRAVESGDVEQRTAAINRAQGALGELQAALDFERGGEVARLLHEYYTRARAQLIEAQTNQAPGILNSVMSDLSSLRDAWREVERSVDGPSEPTSGTGSSEGSPRRGGSGTQPEHWSA